MFLKEYEVKTIVEGRVFTGRAIEEKGIVTVTCTDPMGSKSKNFDNNGEYFANLLLREIVFEHLKKHWR